MGPLSLGEGVRLALDQLRADKFRTGLTILGIVIGVATVMAMSALIGGVRSTIMTELESMGPQNFMVSRFDMTGPVVTDESRPRWWDYPKLTVAEARLLERLPTIHSATPQVNTNAGVAAGTDRVASVEVQGNGADWDSFSNGRFLEGRNFLEADVRAARPVVVLSPNLAAELFGGRTAIGRRVRIGGADFEVVGVYELANSIFAAAMKNWAMVPYTTALKYLDVWDEMMQVLVVPAEGVAQQTAIDDAIVAMRTARGLRPGDENNFAVIRQAQLLDQFNQITGMFFLIMIALSSVALLVGGVGVIAMMMIAVTERTREIGVRKALGATRKEILWQFLVEAATITVIGCIIGMAIGGGIAALIASATPVPAHVPLGAVIAALVMAAIAGIVFGMWPASRASRLDPVEALRYE